MIVAPRVGPIFGTYALLLLILSAVLSILALLLVSLRIYDARRTNRGWRWDLILVVFATILSFVLQCVCGIISCLNGLGTPQSELSDQQVALTMMYAWAGVVMGLFSLAFGKMAIIAMYLYVTRVCACVERAFLWGMGIIVFLSAIVQSVLILAECDPPKKLFYLKIPGKCDGKELSTNFAYFSGAFSALTDLVLAIYPIFIVMRFHCSRTTKISVCAVMAGGLLPFAASVGRTASTWVFHEVQDQTHKYVILFLWGITEQWLIIILGSLPPLRAYFARWLKLDETPDTSSTLGLTGTPQPVPTTAPDTASPVDEKSPWPPRLPDEENGTSAPFQIDEIQEAQRSFSESCLEAMDEIKPVKL